MSQNSPYFCFFFFESEFIVLREMAPSWTLHSSMLPHPILISLSVDSTRSSNNKLIKMGMN